ncbi:MAG: hypothetical protein AAB455_03595 [Patescibacteria group bacterium]
MDLVAMGVAENRKNFKMTLLHRPNGTWPEAEVGWLVSKLGTVATHHPEHPEHLLLWGHYTKEQTLKALGGGKAYTASMVTGMQAAELPFVPSFF